MWGRTSAGRTVKATIEFTRKQRQEFEALLSKVPITDEKEGREDWVQTFQFEVVEIHKEG